jgi:hypothetical protein
MRGTAIVVKCQHNLTNILTLPPGRVIAATFRGVSLVNIQGVREGTDQTSGGCSLC